MQNILLSSIFRKLPLKLLLVILAVVSVFIACTQASYVTNGVGMLQYGGNTTTRLTFTNFNNGKGGGDTRCMVNDPNNYCNLTATSEYTNESVTINSSRQIGCLTGLIDATYSIILKNNASSTCQQARSFLIDSSDWWPWSENKCELEYNLIPISSVDQNYCTTNNLCPSYDCPNVGVSNLFINDIFHPGAFNIIMNIPEEIDWDYAYTNSGSNINIDVVGYNQDTEYINGLIDINNYKPDTEDFTKVFMLFKEYSGLLLACLFVILVFYFVKKSFK